VQWSNTAKLRAENSTQTTSGFSPDRAPQTECLSVKTQLCYNIMLGFFLPCVVAPIVKKQKFYFFNALAFIIDRQNLF
jgi:hypothetical protein